MRKFLTFLLFALLCQYSYGQDKIITKSSQQLDVQIIEHTNKFIRYKMTDYDPGPIIWIKTKRISRIEYKNGVVDMLGNQNPRKSRPLGISAGGAFDPYKKSGFISSSVDYFILPQIDLEINIGTSDLSLYGIYFSAGSRFHLNSYNSENRLTPFTGLLFGSNYGDGFCHIPVGINWLGDSGLNASLSLNEMIGFKSWLVTFFEFRVGWRFKI